MPDTTLAALYGVDPGALNRAAKRNLDPFPLDFMFQLTDAETQALRCQFGISKPGCGGRRYLPYVFTEQGVAMLCGVLHSKEAIRVNVAIMRAFVRLRETLALHKELAAKLTALEEKVQGHDTAIRSLFEAIRQLMSPPPPPPKPEIGFHVKEAPIP